jgi:hypothetical protein
MIHSLFKGYNTMDNLNDEFLLWLDQCPIQWLRLEDNNDNVTYTFYKQNERALNEAN